MACGPNHMSACSECCYLLDEIVTSATSTICSKNSEVGRSEPNREIVSVRSHTRTRAESGSEVGIGGNRWRPVPFPFALLEQAAISRVLCGSSESW